MSLQVIYGRAGSGKHDWFLDRIKEEVQKEPLGPTIYILVPDQMVFQMEYEFVNDSEQNGLMRVQVVSFKRLAWWIMQEVGGSTKNYIDRSGIWMLIRRIIEEQKENLKIYQQSMKHYGFVEQVERIFAEFKRFSIAANDLPHLIEIAKEAKDATLERKLNDLYQLYLPFEHALEEKYLDGTDRLKVLEEQLSKSQKMQGTHLYVAGFYDFTPQELEVLGALMQVCIQVNVVLTMERTEQKQLQENELFYMMHETYGQLMQVALDRKVSVLPDIQIEQKDKMQKKHPSLIHLEKNYDLYPAMPFQGSSTIRQFTAANRRGEIEGIAREIIHLTRTLNYRYEDIILIVRNQEVYTDLIQHVFSQFQLPVYLDRKNRMLSHPLVELLRGTLSIFQTNFRYEAVFRTLKTGLLWQNTYSEIEERRKIDFLENFCLANGIYGKKRWKDEAAFRYVKIYYGEQSFRKQTDEEKEIEAQLKQMRLEIYTPLAKLFQELQEKETVIEKITGIYDFLQEIGVTKRLTEWRRKAEEEGRQEEARQHEQVWDAVMHLFDQLVEMMGTDCISNELFIRLLESGFSSLQFSFVPSALDQIIVGDLEHSRYRHKKIAFIVGVNEGEYPKIVSEDSMLNTHEREKMKEFGVRLDYSARQRTFNDHTMIYMGLTLPTDYLYLTVPLSNEEGKALIPSMLLRRIKEMIPTIQETFFPNDPLDATEETELHFIASTNKAFSYWVRILQEYKKTGYIHSVWWDVYEILREKNFFHLEPLKSRALDSLYYKNEAIQLPKRLTEQLFGTEIEASISRIETFNRCPFQHFLRYGLNLKERDAYEIESSHIGDFYHRCIDEMFHRLDVLGLKWNALSKEEAERFVDETVDKIAPMIQKNIFITSERYRYMLFKLKKVLKQVAWILKLHTSKSDFYPFGMEITFGKNEKMHTYALDLQDGKKLYLKGRIDQVNQAVINGQSYVQIIDYKSSEKKLNWNEVYYGLALQLLTYLDVASQTFVVNDQIPHPAGALYFHVHRPFLKREDGLLHLADVEEDRLKRYKMSGVLVGDEALVSHMDMDLFENGGKSNMIPAELKKDETFSTRSSVVSNENFQTIGKYVRGIFRKSGQAILDGEICLQPTKLGDQTPCTFCDYRSVCQFDRNLAENQYRYLSKTSDKEALQQIYTEGEQI